MIVGGIRVVPFLWSRMNQRVLPRFSVYAGFENEAKEVTKHWIQLNCKFLEEYGRNLVRARCLIRLHGGEFPADFARRNNDNRDKLITEGFRRRIRSIGIVNSRISRKESAAESAFVSRRGSYRTMRMEKEEESWNYRSF